jgi:hypothetical protein
MWMKIFHNVCKKHELVKQLILHNFHYQIMKGKFVTMDYYKFLGTPLKVHYVMVIQKLSAEFIQCDYNIYNIVVLNHFSF